MGDNQSGDNETDADPAKFGYDLYPERKDNYTKTWTGILTGSQGLEEYDRVHCERRVAKCFKTSKLVQLMASALKASGCEIDPSRHVVCEQCHPRVSGGFDTETNQIVICQNNSKDDGVVQGILTHEMIHMFDYCGNNVDFKNIDHLACTEIRAANLTHCSFASAILQGDASLINFANKHKDCVKTKAIMSIIAVRDVSTAEATAAVDRVFNKCYNDMEPIGRRVKGYEDATRAYAEGFLFSRHVYEARRLSVLSSVWNTVATSLALVATTVLSYRTQETESLLALY